MTRRLLAGAALLAGVLAAVAGSPHPTGGLGGLSGRSGHDQMSTSSTSSTKSTQSTSSTTSTSPQQPPAVDRALVDELAGAVEREEDHVTALALAAWIRDRKPGLRVVDLRTQAEFEAFHLPGAERIALSSLTATSFGPDETIVLCSNGGAHAAQAWVFLRTLGHQRVFFLRGGVAEWVAEVQNPAKQTPLTSYFRRDGC